MSRRDLLKSLVHGTAQAASEQLRKLVGSESLAQAFEQVTAQRVRISDEKLTAAVARASGVSAATVTATAGQLRFDVSYEDGTDLACALTPGSVSFAPRGAKEIGFAVTPESAVSNLRCADLLAAVGSEVARGLWAPALARIPRQAPSAFVHRDGSLLTLDLRTVPEVKQAMGKRMGAGLIELLRLRGLSVGEGHLDLNLALEGLAPPE